MKHAVTALIALGALTFTGCSSTATDAEAVAGTEEITLHVMAAASLQKSFHEIAEEFTAENPHISIDFSFAGSSTLVQNLEAGAPADIFASADEANMASAEDLDLIDGATRELFAANKLVGIVPMNNSAEVTNLAEANADDVNLVTCAPQVPCGALSQTLAGAAGLKLSPVSEEQQVSDVLGKVRSGQADAGLVYATDAMLAADEVELFEIDGAEDELNFYPIAVTSHAGHPQAAEAFTEYIRSEPGQAILGANGFTRP